MQSSKQRRRQENTSYIISAGTEGAGERREREKAGRESERRPRKRKKRKNLLRQPLSLSRQLPSRSGRVNSSLSCDLECDLFHPFHSLFLCQLKDSPCVRSRCSLSRACSRSWRQVRKLEREDDLSERFFLLMASRERKRLAKCRRQARALINPPRALLSLPLDEKEKHDRARQWVKDPESLRRRGLIGNRRGRRKENVRRGLSFSTSPGKKGGKVQ